MRMVGWYVSKTSHAPHLMARPPLGVTIFDTMEAVILDHLSRVDEEWQEALPAFNLYTEGKEPWVKEVMRRREGMAIGTRMRRELRREGKRIRVVTVFG